MVLGILGVVVVEVVLMVGVVVALGVAVVKVVMEVRLVLHHSLPHLLLHNDSPWILEAQPSLLEMVSSK